MGRGPAQRERGCGCAGVESDACPVRRESTEGTCPDLGGRVLERVFPPREMVGRETSLPKRVREFVGRETSLLKKVSERIGRENPPLELARTTW